jgi:hypothetical protein
MEWKVIFKESKMEEVMRLSYFFFGEADPRAIEDRKWLKLSLMSPTPELLGSGVLIRG